MCQKNDDQAAQLRRVLDELSDRFLSHPAVSLIDVGHQPRPGQIGDEIVVRIHVRRQWLEARPEDRPAFPDQVAGIPVIEVIGDYSMETPHAEEG